MPNLTNENRSMLLGLGRDGISQLTSELNEELNKVHIHSTEEELKVVFEKCEKTLSNLKSKYEQFKGLAEK